MSNRNELIWEIVCYLYPDNEETAVQIGNSLTKHKSNINSILYEYRNLFSKRNNDYSARPLWSLTTEAREAYESVQNIESKNDEANYLPLFCEECKSLLPNHSPACSHFDMGYYKRVIPSIVNEGKIGLPGYFEIEFSEKETVVHKKNRRNNIFEFLITEFIPVESNKSYVNSFGEPRTKGRINALINHFEGLNVASTPKIMKLRNEEILWLKGLNIEEDLP